MAASIKAGTAAPSAILRRLAAYPRQNALAKALREIGRLERSLFMLDWISDPDFRRRTSAGLNKGEARNALARAAFFHDSAKSATGLSRTSVTAPRASISPSPPSFFGTPSIFAAVDQLRSRDQVIPDELLAHVAPLGWEHIALNGDYVWPTESLGNAFRPLRNLRAEFLDAA
jgi:hypothetical protein